MPQLDERLGVKCLMRPFTVEETAAYAEHRLKTAGAKRTIIDAGAFATLHELTCGIPRRINRLCDLALLIGFAEEAQNPLCRALRIGVPGTGDHRAGVRSNCWRPGAAFCTFHAPREAGSSVELPKNGTPGCKHGADRRLVVAPHKFLFVPAYISPLITRFHTENNAMVDCIIGGGFSMARQRIIHLKNIDDLAWPPRLGTIFGGGATWRCPLPGRNCWPSGWNDSRTTKVFTPLRWRKTAALWRRCP